ncbi:MAG: phosphate ABC transporter ATP-binding protein [Candidatus Hydrogenedens sp.]|jgi:phosphate transport system ATP-binding protein|nr:phosphate ABC transporter ATP-binding protein [Candidatus Hydrogenedens sp.]
MAAEENTPIIEIQNLTVTHFEKVILDNLSLSVHKNERLAIIGPANSGKTTFLRCLNRLNDLSQGFKVTGKILLNGRNIFHPATDTAQLRRKVGMVYAVPVPLPWSIYENLVYGPKLAGIKNKNRLDELVENSLKAAFLWDEVKDRLHMAARNLSGGQQQRLCVARVLALEPEVLVLDEPCSALDPISTAKIEDALFELKSRHAIVLVTNNTKQAARASDRTAFFLMGQLIEMGDTGRIFTNPVDKRTNDYLIGAFG